MTDDEPKKTEEGQSGQAESPAGAPSEKGKLKEIGGPEGPEPTRFGDWERNGRCYDF